MSVLRGHSVFSSPPQRPIFYPRFYPLDLFSYLNSWERAIIFPFECLVLNKDTTGTIFITSLVWRGPWLGIEPGPPALEASTIPLGFRGGGNVKYVSCGCVSECSVDDEWMQCIWWVNAVYMMSEWVYMMSECSVYDERMSVNDEWMQCIWWVNECSWWMNECTWWVNTVYMMSEWVYMLSEWVYMMSECSVYDEWMQCIWWVNECTWWVNAVYMMSGCSIYDEWMSVYNEWMSVYDEWMSVYDEWLSVYDE